MWFEQRANYYLPPTTVHVCILGSMSVTYRVLRFPIKLTARIWPKMLKVAFNTNQSSQILYKYLFQTDTLQQYLWRTNTCHVVLCILGQATNHSSRNQALIVQNIAGIYAAKCRYFYFILVFFSSLKINDNYQYIELTLATTLAADCLVLGCKPLPIDSFLQWFFHPNLGTQVPIQKSMFLSHF